MQAREGSISVDVTILYAHRVLRIDLERTP